METEIFESTYSFQPKRKDSWPPYSKSSTKLDYYLIYKIQKTNFNFPEEFILKANSQNNFLLLGGKCLAR